MAETQSVPGETTQRDKINILIGRINMTVPGVSKDLFQGTMQRDT